MSGARFLEVPVNPTNQQEWNRRVADGLNKVRSGIVNVNPVAASYTVIDSDYLVTADATAGAVTITLPPIATQRGRVLVVKKLDASANAVTIDGAGSETIDGATTKATTTRYATFYIIGGVTEWHLIL